MKYIQPLKMLMVAAAIATPLCLIVSVPAFAAKPVKETVCNVGSPPYLSILSAVADTNCDSINVPAGTYYEHVTIGSTSPPTARNVTIRGAGPGSTIVDGGNSGSVFIVHNSTVTLKGMTITNGLATGPYPNGGGIGSAFSTLTVKDCLITGNHAPGLTGKPGRGGGLHSVYGTLIVKDSTITNNSAASGGGINGGASPNVITVMDSVIADNEATEQGGGIISITSGTVPGAVTVKDTTITRNDAGKEGGGIYVTNTTLTVKDSTITDNAANQVGDSYQGGGIYLANSTLTVKDSTITGNTPNNIYP